MKKFLIPLLVLGLLVGISTVVWSSILGTPHDVGVPEPCAMCHTPHNGAGEYPLWNRNQTAQVYTLYSSISFDMSKYTPYNAPKSPSSLCLVCHNGVASELVNYPGPCSNLDPAYDLALSGCADLGIDLTDDHPLAFTYAPGVDNATDNNVFPAVTSYTRPSGAVRKYIQSPTLVDVKYWLYNGDNNNTAFECATCHSVHDLVDYDGKDDYQVRFLRRDNTGSDMCLDCHTKK
jgi:hypothetical protein